MPSADERAVLIAAIREAPDDDAPRLVFADWLEERGDEASGARAEFIRVQLQRANLPIEDERHSELQARELRLLKRWAGVWCGSHFGFKKVRFRRGLIEFVHLHLTHFLHHRRQLLALEPVRDVRLTGWHRASEDLVRRVAACEEWRDIETLRIHHQGPHKDPRGEVVTLLESPHLTRLRAARAEPGVHGRGAAAVRAAGGAAAGARVEVPLPGQLPARPRGVVLRGRGRAPRGVGRTDVPRPAA